MRLRTRTIGSTAAIFIALNLSVGVAAAAPVITSMPTTISISGEFTITGTGFTAGSVINFFVATASGPQNVGPFNPTVNSAPTRLTFSIPATVTLGEGVASVRVVNTDQGYASSNLAYAQLVGNIADGLPTIMTINGSGFDPLSLNPDYAVDFVDSLLFPGKAFTIGGTGFDDTNGVAVDVFCACPGGKVTYFIAPGQSGTTLTATQIAFTVPALGSPNAPVTGPASVRVSNAGSAKSYGLKSNSVAMTIAPQLTITNVTVRGCQVIVTGTGFSNLTVINLFNLQSTVVVNLGGLNGGNPVIPLDIVNSTEMTFGLPPSAVAGPAYVQALAPPFVPATSTGNTPNGAFTAPNGCGFGAASSGLFAVDCATNRAYVPLGTFDPATGNGRVAVVDLTKNPNAVNPDLPTVVLTHPDIPNGTAADQANGMVFTSSGTSLDVINEKTDQLIAGSPFSLPPGSEAGSQGQVLFDPVRNKAIVGVVDIPSGGCSTFGACTGFSLFDEATHLFGPVQQASYAETIAYSAAANLLLNCSDSNPPLPGEIQALDLTHGLTCSFTDPNLGNARFDLDGVSIDPTTDIILISDEPDGQVLVANLNGAQFSGSGSSCTLNEAGTPPNSILLNAQPSAAGSAINPATHEGVVIGDLGNIAMLLQLPSTPVAQLISIPPPVQATLPNDPNNATWATKSDPYAIAVANCPGGGDYAYLINNAFTFLAQIDLSAMASNPSAISTPLPPGNCAGTSTASACSNGAGVTFFPLPQ